MLCALSDAHATPIPSVNARDPLGALADVTGDGQVAATDASIILRGAVGTVATRPSFDVDGSAGETGTGGVTATDALLALRRAVGLPLPANLLDWQEFRREMTRWLLGHQNVRGLIEFTPGALRLAATYDQGIAGVALLAQYDALVEGLVIEENLTPNALLAAVRAIVEFYLAKYEQAEAGAGFRGFAEFYAPATGQPDYTVGAGGNLAGPNAYVLALAAQFVGRAGGQIAPAFAGRVVSMAEGIADWLASLERTDGGVRFGTIGNGPTLFSFASTEHNLSVRDSLACLATLLDARGDATGRDRVQTQAARVDGFLANVVWSPALGTFAAGVDAANVVDQRRFADLFGLAGLSPFPLPGGSSKSAFLPRADPLLRKVHPLDVEPGTSADGYGSVDRSGIQSEWTAEIAFAWNYLDNQPGSGEKPNLWHWAYFLRQIARARIDETDGGGSGLAQAAKAHDSGFGGFGGFVWDSTSVAPATVAWWILASLDFHPFLLVSPTSSP
jgi:hypothetical protein